MIYEPSSSRVHHLINPMEAGATIEFCGSMPYTSINRFMGFVIYAIGSHIEVRGPRGGKERGGCMGGGKGVHDMVKNVIINSEILGSGKSYEIYRLGSRLHWCLPAKAHTYQGKHNIHTQTLARSWLYA